MKKQTIHCKALMVIVLIKHSHICNRNRFSELTTTTTTKVKI